MSSVLRTSGIDLDGGLRSISTNRSVDTTTPAMAAHPAVPCMHVRTVVAISLLFFLAILLPSRRKVLM